MMIKLLEMYIRRCIEENGKPPDRIGLTKEQWASITASIPFSVRRDATPKDKNTFMGIPVEIVEVE